jgi:hypothetical protein
VATTPTSVQRPYQASKLVGTKYIQHASSFSMAPTVAKYAKYKQLGQKLIRPMEESHTKEQSPKTVSEMELRAKI